MRKIAWKKIGLAILSVLLFLLAIQLMKDGAQTVAPVVQGLFDVNNAVNSLGFGWLFAYLIFSGSPVAAIALAFLDVGVMGAFETFTMISGSRIGASFIVLFVGLLYILRGHERLASLSMGILSFVVTLSLQLPSLVIGYVVLTHYMTEPIQLRIGGSLISVLDVLYGPIVAFILEKASGWLAFVIGVAIIMLSFNLFDRALPQLHLDKTGFAQIPSLIYRPIIMFFVGLTVTAVSMSVSISLSILVPLSARGYVRSENAIAYIMGANVSTFVDTLLVALVLRNPMATTVVVVQMVAVALVSVVTLLLLYRPYERAVLSLTHRVAGSNRNMIIFAAIILVTPIIVMLM